MKGGVSVYRYEAVSRFRRWPSLAVWLVAVFVALGCSGVAAQDPGSWIVRLGAVGSGTADEGTWNFRSATGLGAEAFTFSNSWGVALSGERIFADRVHVGLHVAHATTDFALSVTPPGGGPPFRSADRTSYAPILGEVYLSLLPGRLANPRVGLLGGVLMTRDVRLRTAPGESEIAYEFENPGIGGYGIGVDLRLGEGGQWIASFDIKSLGFAYAVGSNEMVDSQTLLDQAFATSFNQLVLSLGRRW